MAIAIRPGTPADLQAICEIEATSFARGWSLESLQKEVARPHTRLFVAQDDDEVVFGYCLLWLVVDEAEILTLAIDPSRRRRGHGKRLLEGVMAAVAAQGAKCIYLDVAESNDAGRALYTSAGFVQIGERKQYYEGREKALVLRRELAALSVANG